MPPNKPLPSSNVTCGGTQPPFTGTEFRIVSAFLRFDGSLERDPAIDRWINGQRGEFAALARRWFAAIRHCGSDVRELMHDGCPTACVQDAPFAYVNVFSAHVNVGFFHGAALPDPTALLEGTGKSMRHVKLKPGHVVDAHALEGLVTAAYDDIRVRLTGTE